MAGKPGEGVQRLLATFGGTPASESRIAALVAGRGLPAGWADRETAGYVNDAGTAAFEIPLDQLTGAAGLHFAQDVWMLRPSVFEYVTLGDVAVVRLGWAEEPPSHGTS
ncbi:hypothetical protein [Limnoglobus roseus]|uniref:Uncharacterized protein n=1 Tax=Limnoglobus roseus TaxID=2598579 RepID=A0A5C1AH87_9BACT|nr:hypothetical protein [Limnoglobus roseus]QEL17527.1 hypothetical protein PX52LOC_04517 [Limnoglobus roseus]